MEIGYNRIRKTGFEAISESIRKSKIRVLGIRYNHLSMSSINGYLKSNPSKRLKMVFIKNNEFRPSEYKHSKTHILTDIGSLVEDQMERTIWYPSPPECPSLLVIKENFEKANTGEIVNIRIRKGKDYENKNEENKSVFIEFADKQGVENAIIKF